MVGISAACAAARAAKRSPASDHSEDSRRFTDNRMGFPRALHAIQRDPNWPISQGMTILPLLYCHLRPLACSSFVGFKSRARLPHARVGRRQPCPRWVNASVFAMFRDMSGLPQTSIHSPPGRHLRRCARLGHLLPFFRHPLLRPDEIIVGMHQPRPRHLEGALPRILTGRFIVRSAGRRLDLRPVGLIRVEEQK